MSVLGWRQGLESNWNHKGTLEEH